MQSKYIRSFGMKFEKIRSLMLDHLLSLRMLYTQESLITLTRLLPNLKRSLTLRLLQLPQATPKLKVLNLGLRQKLRLSCHSLEKQKLKYPQNIVINGLMGQLILSLKLILEHSL